MIVIVHNLQQSYWFIRDNELYSFVRFFPPFVSVFH